MTYTNNDLVTGPATQAAKKLIWPLSCSPKTFANGTAVTLAVGTPVAFNTSTAKWQAWAAPTNEVQTIGLGSASAGTFSITFAGQTTAAIAYSASAATVQAALLLLDAFDTGDVVVTGGPLPAVITLTFGGQYQGNNVPVVVVAEVSTLTGGTITVATGTAGVDDFGVSQIAGFVYPDSILIDATNDVLGVVMTRGEINYESIELVSPNTATQLKLALRSGPRTLGLDIKNLDAVH
jgi:hypothetical protein